MLVYRNVGPPPASRRVADVGSQSGIHWGLGVPQGRPLMHWFALINHHGFIRIKSGPESLSGTHGILIARTRSGYRHAV